MNPQDVINYNRIAAAIDFIKSNFKDQPNLDAVAAHVHMSPFHFQRLFSQWVGTTPKKFLQYISIEYAKDLLKEKQVTLSDVAHDTGFSSTSRLHDLFINIEGMSPAEFKNAGRNLTINYSFSSSPFGNVVVAATTKGVCYLAFYEDQNQAFEMLQKYFSNADFVLQMDVFQQNALRIFDQDWNDLPEIKLHLKATDFQLKVWEALLKVPFGQLANYGTIANTIQNPKASRAVGTAIGSNPVAFLIPCHRVIQSSGVFGGYMWGNTRKTAIIGWEAAKIDLHTTEQVSDF
jgi:AraC family transcriptional regulator of adaptative response/methylated-DNA-[protein]-cysteine methyltransferase